MRALTSLACAALLPLCAVAVTGCGGGGAAPRHSAAPVRLTLSTPSDEASTRSDTLTVSGSVTPADAAVRVLGRPADVVAGSFTARVPLDPGTNVIDLAATARGHGPALAAVRVTREMPIAVPDLGHLTPDQASARLSALGLRLRTQSDGGLFEGILPGTPGVCEQRPEPGTEVRKGSAVLALVAKRC
jgi:Glucodextranase, domain B/PASTA domain